MPLEAAVLARRPAAAELLEDHVQTIRSGWEPGGSETTSVADARVSGLLEELEGLGLSSDAMAMAAVVETVSRELLADWAVKNE
eukprot:810915-Alexandrium_andersonii.AAC.1